MIVMVVVVISLWYGYDYILIRTVDGGLYKGYKIMMVMVVVKISMVWL